MEEPIRISSGDVVLEGLIESRVGDEGVVVTHPHPLYGGDMYNYVVGAVVEAYGSEGFTTLRFNFRGVGRSDGEFDHGRGEQEDVKQAVAELIRRGLRTIHLAGYSFGAWVNAGALPELPEVAEMVMVSPPAAMMDFSFLRPDPKIRLVVTGERDDIAVAEQLAEMVPVWNPKASFFVISGADHFFGAHAEGLMSVLRRHLNRGGIG